MIFVNAISEIRNNESDIWKFFLNSLTEHFTSLDNYRCFNSCTGQPKSRVVILVAKHKGDYLNNGREIDNLLVTEERLLKRGAAK